jgi:hypothetical protein
VAHPTADRLSLPGFQERFKGYRELPWSGPEGQSPLKQEAIFPERPGAGYSWRVKLIDYSVIDRLGLNAHSGPFDLSPKKKVVSRDYSRPLVSLVF